MSFPSLVDRNYAGSFPARSFPGSVALTTANIADAVWDEATADHTTAGSFGKFVQGLPGIGKMIALIKDL